MRKNRSDKIFDIINYTLMILLFLAVAYPLYFVVIASVSDPNMVNSGNVILWPKGFSLEAYKRIFKDSSIWIGYRNSIIYTITAVLINLAITIPAGYALSRKDLYGQKGLMFFFVFVMYFQGGTIPSYLVVKQLGLMNTMWAVILPTCLSVYNLIICKNYFENSLPGELLDAAKVDGASNLKFFFGIAIPLSKALIAVMVLFYGVQQWNSYFDAMIYLNAKEKQPLQIVLRNILLLTQISSSGAAGDAESVAEMQRISGLIKYGVIVVSSVPMLVLYPFVQKHFVKGIMVGSVKG